MPGIKLIIFDFDGTLADTMPIIFDIVTTHAKDYGIKPPTDAQKKAIRSMSPGEIIREFHIPLYKIPFLLIAGKRELEKRISDVHTFPGIQKMIQTLEKKGYILGVLTSNNKRSVEKFFALHDIVGFDFIQSEFNLFGKDKALKGIMKKHKIDPEHVVYVGDEVRDLEASQKAGVLSVAVTWGFSTKEILMSHKPTYIVYKASDITQIFS